jgi:uncharacterized membrane protein YkvA (DUF1232 family)
VTALGGKLGRLVREIDAFRLMVADPRTPWVARVLLAAAIAYLLSPIDIIPDFIPVLGHLDDLVVVGLLVWLGLRFTPRAVRDDCRHRAGAGTAGASS